MRCTSRAAFHLGRVAVVALSAAAAAGQTRDPHAAAPAGTGTMAGRVTVAGEPNVPVRRARITLESSGLSQPQLADTDADGRFRFDHLPPGVYRLRAEKPGFVTMTFGARHAFDRGLPIDVVTGETRAASFSLPRGAALEGRIVNAEGDPVQNLVVSAVRLSFGRYGRQPLVIKDARTDDLGRYRIHSLPAGEYFVQAAPDPLEALTRRDAPGPRPPGLARSFYPGTADSAQAERVTLQAGRDAGGLDFTPVTVPLARVTVRVENSGGTPVASPGIRLQRVGAPPGEIRGAMLPKEAVFPAVPAGDFWVMAAVPGEAGGAPEHAVVRYAVAGADLALTLKTQALPGLRGSVVSDAGALPDLSRTRVRVETVDYELPNPGGSGGATPAMPQVAADGSFESSGTPGRWIVRLEGLPAGWALSSVRLGEAEIADVATETRPAEPAVPLVVTITSRTGAVSGTVISGGEKQPVPNARVVLFPADERQWDVRSRFIRTTLTGPDGAYTIDGLLPGNYLACSVEWLDEGSWLDADVLRRLGTIATRVAVEAAGRQSLGLVLGELR